jgi:hypothetical protein
VIAGWGLERASEDHNRNQLDAFGSYRASVTQGGRCLKSGNWFERCAAMPDSNGVAAMTVTWHGNIPMLKRRQQAPHAAPTECVAALNLR